MIDKMNLSENPVINALSNEEFNERIRPVFEMLGNTLAKSFGPYGANTFISNYPYIHTTKDGYTIMKNLAFSDLIDRVIADLAEKICNRLNSTVGDGTTSSIIATNAIYQAWREKEDMFKQMKLLPRDILKKFDEVKNIVIDELRSKAININTGNPEELAEYIKQIVYVSSNGDETITNAISNLYKELEYPAIDVILSHDGVTRYNVIEGYPIDITLTDGVYINNDDNTLKANSVDVIVFSHKVTSDTYKYILKPLNETCRLRERKLLVIAPFYDDIAIQSIMRQDLLDEYKRTKSINMILTACTNTSAHARLMLEDLTMLFNTVIINRNMENEIIEKLTVNKETIIDVFNIDFRQIPNTKVLRYTKTFGFRLETEDNAHSEKSHYIQLGYSGKVSIGLKSSIFSDFSYDESLRERHIKDAREKLREAEEKYTHMGIFNTEVTLRQRRLYALNLKMGSIEVGGESEMMQGYLKDAVDDAVKAASSAYKHGIILGCNVSMLQALSTVENMMIIDNDNIGTIITRIIMKGFTTVYHTVISNMFEDEIYNPNSDRPNIATSILSEAMKYAGFELIAHQFSGTSVYDNIVDISTSTGMVFDLTSRRFVKNVLNSCETDIEILKATTDLISLLVSGNQLVMTAR